MTSSKIYEENGERGGTMPFQIVIEAEGLSDSETMLCLRVDTRLIARNLTTAQTKFLVGEILDRIAASEGEKEPKAVSDSCTDASASRAPRSLLARRDARSIDTSGNAASSPNRLIRRARA
jgi:hypothetical protein